MADLLTTPLHPLHLSLGAKMMPFAGYEMPLQYPPGVMKEHLHSRSRAGLFDVSHMGQVQILPKSGDVSDAARAFERLVPADIVGLRAGRQRYAVLTDDGGGIRDDLMVAHRQDHLFVVVNAACKHADIAYMTAELEGTCDVVPVTGRALIALQGPMAAAVLSALAPGAGDLRFMDVATIRTGHGALWISRSGYTGDDGFEISVPSENAEALARALLEDADVAPIGLGARDSLRLEAGLCLYGADLDTTTSPVEAGLEWSVGKPRRSGGDRAGGFPGADRILRELAEGPARRRVGLRPEGRAPMRAGTRLFAGGEDTDEVTAEIGAVTSGAFGPSVEAPISMGYVAAAHSREGTTLYGEVRGKRLPATVTALPFRAPTYKR